MSRDHADFSESNYNTNKISDSSLRFHLKCGLQFVEKVNRSMPIFIHLILGGSSKKTSDPMCEKRQVADGMQLEVQTEDVLWRGKEWVCVSIKTTCFKIHHSTCCGIFFELMNLTYCVIFSILPEYDRDNFNNGQLPTSASIQIGPTNVFDLLEYISFVVLVVEVTVGFVALGTDSGRLVWLETSRFHQIDLAVLLLTALDYALLFVLDTRRFPFRMLRLFRLLRPMLRIPAFAELCRLLQTLSHGAGQIRTVLLVLLFFTLTFALSGAYYLIFPNIPYSKTYTILIHHPTSTGRHGNLPGLLPPPLRHGPRKRLCVRGRERRQLPAIAAAPVRRRGAIGRHRRMCVPPTPLQTHKDDLSFHLYSRPAQPHCTSDMLSMPLTPLSILPSPPQIRSSGPAKSTEQLPDSTLVTCPSIPPTCTPIQCVCAAQLKQECMLASTQYLDRKSYISQPNRLAPQCKVIRYHDKDTVLPVLDTVSLNLIKTIGSPGYLKSPTLASHYTIKVGCWARLP